MACINLSAPNKQAADDDIEFMSLNFSSCFREKQKKTSFIAHKSWNFHYSQMLPFDDASPTTDDGCETIRWHCNSMNQLFKCYFLSVMPKMPHIQIIVIALWRWLLFVRRLCVRAVFALAAMRFDAMCICHKMHSNLFIF